MKLMPENRAYSAVLCLIIIGAAVFLSSFIPRTEEPVRTTSTGRPILEEDGKVLLWAGKDHRTLQDTWWDMTNSPIDLDDLDHGLGADQIASIDEPIFTHKDDPRWHERQFNNDFLVIGVEYNGIARAYPQPMMSRHELVNDTFGDTHLAVAY